MDIADFLDRLGVSDYSIDWESHKVYVSPRHFGLVEIAVEHHPEVWGWKIEQFGEEWEIANSGRCGLRLHESH